MDETGASESPRGPAGLVDRLNRRIGRLAGWLTLAMVLIGAANALGRYFGRFAGMTLSSNALIELQWYLFSLVFLLTAADTLRRNRHVRVDVLYGRLGARGKAWIDLAGSLLFLLPFTTFMMVVSWPSVRNSWQVREASPDPGGLARYPLKTVVLVAFALLFLQGLAEVGRSWRQLREGRPREGGRREGPPSHDAARPMA